MSPTYSADDVRNGTLIKGKISGNGSLIFATSTPSTYLDYVGRGEARSGAFFAACTTVLRNHISSVVGGGSDKKMLDVCALPIITLMKNISGVRDVSVCQNPDQSVNAPTAAKLWEIFPKAGLAVAVFVNVASPYEAAVRLANKPVINGACRRAILLSSRNTRKVCAAVSAFFWGGDFRHASVSHEGLTYVN